MATVIIYLLKRLWNNLLRVEHSPCDLTGSLHGSMWSPLMKCTRHVLSSWLWLVDEDIIMEPKMSKKTVNGGLFCIQMKGHSCGQDKTLRIQQKSMRTFLLKITWGSIETSLLDTMYCWPPLSKFCHPKYFIIVIEADCENCCLYKNFWPLPLFLLIDSPKISLFCPTCLCYAPSTSGRIYLISTRKDRNDTTHSGVASG